jgi:SAM-dependent methyltransferase
MDRIDARVVASYEMNPQREENRLSESADNFHRLEFETTVEYLEKYLPAGGRILDAGCGTGRYSGWLLERGYTVVAIDLTPGHVVLARELRGDDPNFSVEIGDVRAMSFAADKFDAVLCTGGVLSHLETDRDRIMALTELGRVAKPAAPIFVGVMSRWGIFNQYGLPCLEELADGEYFRTLAIQGEDHRWHRGEGYAHYYTLDEFLKLLVTANITVLGHVGLQGLTTGAVDEYNAMDRDSVEFANWREFLRSTRELPVMADLSSHFLMIVQK